MYKLTKDTDRSILELLFINTVKYLLYHHFDYTPCFHLKTGSASTTFSQTKIPSVYKIPFANVNVQGLTVYVSLVHDLCLDELLDDVLQRDQAHRLVERIPLALVVHSVHECHVTLDT